MGKHDIKDRIVAASSDEFTENRIRDLESRLAFANETIKKLQEQCGRMSKWANEIEANAEDKVTELEAENAKLRGKILKLVNDYVV